MDGYALLAIAAVVSRVITSAIDLDRSTPDVQLTDVLHKTLPYIPQASHVADVIMAACLLLTPFVTKDSNKYARVYAIILLVRAILMSVTILPDKCAPHFHRYGRNSVFGGCRDKCFSGHTATALLFALICVSSGLSRAVFAVPAAVSVLMLVSRSHYTLDIVVAWATVAAVWQNRQLLIYTAA